MERVAGVMADLRIHCVAVVGAARRDEGDEHFVWGLLSDMDVLHAVNRGGSGLTAGELAVTSPLALPGGAGLERAASLMVEHDATHVVVVDTAARPPAWSRRWTCCGSSRPRPQRSRAWRMWRPSDAIAGSALRNSRARPWRYSSSCARNSRRPVDGDPLVGVLGRRASRRARSASAGEFSPSNLAPRPPERRALGVAATAEPAGAVANGQPAVDHRLAWIGLVVDAGCAGDPRRGAARLMCRQTAPGGTTIAIPFA